MIKSVTVLHDLVLDEPLTLDLENSHEKTGIYISNITGIGPSKANINTVSLASDDGGIFNSAKLEVRNIVLTLGFHQSVLLGNSIEDSRQLTYKYFPNKKNITLIFETDNRSLYIEGYVESNEPDIFSKEETTQISIICPDPRFYDADGNEDIAFGGVDDEFEFPYSHESLNYEPSPSTINLTEFGKLVMAEFKSITYTGDEDTGINIYIHPISNVSGLEIGNLNTNQLIIINDSIIGTITGSTGILANDEITLCTIKGRKSAKLTRGGTTYNIINALGRNPAWFQLSKGDNIFFFSAESGGTDLEMTISYETAFTGV